MQIPSPDRIIEVKGGNTNEQIRKRDDVPAFFASASIFAAPWPISFVNDSTGMAAKTVSK